jgi:acyl-coenzyme A thioesterase PaaI-like protein
MDTHPALRYVTASLKVDYRAPTPQGVELELRGEIVEVGARKVVVDIEVSASSEVCATGRVIAVRMPDRMMP